MNRETASRTIFVVWCFIAGILALLLLGQTIGGAYGEDADLAWTWLSGVVLAPMTIVFAAAFSEPSRNWKSKPASRFRVVTALVSSAILALLALGAILAEPFVEPGSFDLFRKLAFPIALVQAVVVSSISFLIFEGR